MKALVAPKSPIRSFMFTLGHSLRVFDRNGAPWFVSADVCEVLHIQTRDVRKVLEPHEVETGLVDSIHLKNGAGRPASTFISESGLYSLILKSRRPEAKEFKRWVMQQVLPAIRRDGAYVMGEEKVATGERAEDELIARAFTALAAKAERLAAEKAKLQVENHELVAVNGALA